MKFSVHPFSRCKYEQDISGGVRVLKVVGGIPSRRKCDTDVLAGRHFTRLPVTCLPVTGLPAALAYRLLIYR